LNQIWSDIPRSLDFFANIRIL